MNVTIVAVGKIKEKYIKDAIEEYSKRLSRYCRLTVVEVDDEQAPDKLSRAQELQVMQAEALRIKKQLKDGTYIVALDVQGVQVSSEELADRINSLGVSGKSNVVFIIGGSLGMDAELVSMADLRLSMSRMTFPHQLARVLLLEQVYRAFKINSGETYHK